LIGQGSVHFSLFSLQRLNKQIKVAHDNHIYFAVVVAILTMLGILLGKTYCNNDKDYEDRLKELKIKVREANLGYNFTEKSYERFLKGRKMDVNIAYNSMVDHVKWRKESKTDQITKESVQDIIDKEFCYVHKKDKAGRPVLYTFLQKHDKDNRDIDKLKNYMIYVMDDAIKQSSKEEKITIVYDMTGFTLKNLDFVFTKMFIDMLQKNYPEVRSLR
jgi:hypothetical protein